MGRFKKIWLFLLFLSLCLDFKSYIYPLLFCCESLPVDNFYLFFWSLYGYNFLLGTEMSENFGKVGDEVKGSDFIHVHNKNYT